MFHNVCVCTLVDFYVCCAVVLYFVFWVLLCVQAPCKVEEQWSDSWSEAELQWPEGDWQEGRWQEGHWKVGGTWQSGHWQEGHASSSWHSPLIYKAHNMSHMVCAGSRQCLTGCGLDY